MSDDRTKAPRGTGRRGRPSKKTEALVDLAEAMLGKAEKRAVKAAIMKQADCSARLAEDVISLARERLRLQVNEPADVLRGTYLAVYNSIAFDTTRDPPPTDREGNPTGQPGRRRVSDRDRIMAASAAAKLLGLEIHAPVQASGRSELLRDFFDDPVNAAAAFPPGALPAPPDPATDDAEPRTDPAADAPPDQAVEAPPAA